MGGRRSTQGAACSNCDPSRTSRSSRPYARHALHPAGQPVVGPTERQRQRRLTRQVEHPGERPGPPRCIALLVRAERRAGLGRGRRDQDVVPVLVPVPPPARRPLGELVLAVEQGEHSGPTHRSPLLHHSPRQRLDVGLTESPSEASGPAVQLGGGVRREQGARPGEQVGLEQGRRHVLLDVVPELLQQARGVRGRRRASAVDVDAVERTHAQPDPQATGVRAHLGDQRARQWLAPATDRSARVR